MKELLQNKIMIGMIVFVMCITYINSVQTQKYEESIKIDDVVMNVN